MNNLFIAFGKTHTYKSTKAQEKHTQTNQQRHKKNTHKQINKVTRKAHTNKSKKSQEKHK